jgi:hypothetical protein
MRPDAFARATNVREKAEVFAKQGFERTSNGLLQLAEAIAKGQAIGSKDVTKILFTYRDEVHSKGNDSFLTLHDFIQRIVFAALETLRERYGDKLDELLPRIRSMNNAATIAGEAANLISRSNPSNKERFYGACMIYLWITEGLFDEACRLLYALCKASIGQNTPLAALEKLSLRTIRVGMRQLTNAESETLFLGWEDNHLRNAIAHMHLEYDEATGKMRFIDGAYDRKLSLNEFSEYYHLTLGVSTVFLHIMMILRARDMAMATNPFQVDV